MVVPIKGDIVDGVMWHGNACAGRQVQVPSHNGIMILTNPALADSHRRVHAQGLLHTRLQDLSSCDEHVLAGGHEFPHRYC